MFIKSIIKSNSKKGKQFYYYRLVESYRLEGKSRHRTVLNLGAIACLDNDVIKRKALANRIEELIHGSKVLFPRHVDEEIEQLAHKYYAELVQHKWSQTIEEQADKTKIEEDYRKVDVNSISHEDVREIGGEWLCKTMLDRLELGKCLKSLDWSDKWVTMSLISVISRAVYASSEHKTAQYLQANSGLLNLFDLPYDGVNRYHLYEAANRLYGEKEKIEQHLSRKTDELFDQKDTIILYDLTNVYFEGRKEGSEKAAYGRSKEKRSDAKLLVLAVVVNMNGFVKYSQFYKGNMSESKTLEQIISDMERNSGTQTSKKLIVMDAGIATEENLKMLRNKEYDYLCVSRRKLADYGKLADYEAQLEQDMVHLTDQKGNPIEMKRLKREAIPSDTAADGKAVKEEPDYFIYVWSTEKQRKEQSMEDKLSQRYTSELEKIAKAIKRKGGVKKEHKVWERLGRIKQKYSRVNPLFDIKVQASNGIATQLEWTKKDRQADKSNGVYFLRTTLADDKEENLWKIYQTLKEIEYTFRVLKTDLNLRPIYHHNDQTMEAHLFLGILAYQMVCSIRYQLKQHDIHHDWTNIIRIMGTHKVLTTFLKGENENIFITKTCRPKPEALNIYKAMGMSSMPFKMKKSVVPH